MPTLLSKLLQATAVTTATSIGAIFVYTKHTHSTPINPTTDSALTSPSFRKYNPNNNPSLSDELTRRIALTKIRPELIRDANAGGSKLLDSYTAGFFTSFAYAPQRLFTGLGHRGPETSHQLWTKEQLAESDYAPGTEIADHFKVLERSESTILMRSGDSTLVEPEGPREKDGLVELGARVDMDRGFAEFRMRSVFYDGVGRKERAPYDGQGVVLWLHAQYSKLLMESALRKCMRGSFERGG